MTNSDSNNVSKINPANNTVVGAVGVGLNPEGIAFDGTHIWVTNTGSNYVSKIPALP